MLSELAAGAVHRLLALGSVLLEGVDAADATYQHSQARRRKNKGDEIPLDPNTAQYDLYMLQQEHLRRHETQTIGVTNSKTPYRDALNRIVARYWSPIRRFYDAVRDLLSWALSDAMMHLRGKAYK